MAPTRTLWWLVTVVLLGSTAFADTVRLVPMTPTLDDPRRSAFLDAELPAGAPFTLEYMADVTEEDRAVAVIVADDGRCAPWIARLGRMTAEDTLLSDLYSNWGDCPQHYELALRAKDGKGSVLSATVPALQIDERYHIYVLSRISLSHVLLPDAPERVGDILIANIDAGVAQDKALELALATIADEGIRSHHLRRLTSRFEQQALADEAAILALQIDAIASPTPAAASAPPASATPNATGPLTAYIRARLDEKIAVRELADAQQRAQLARATFGSALQFFRLTNPPDRIFDDHGKLVPLSSLLQSTSKDTWKAAVLQLRAIDDRERGHRFTEWIDILDQLVAAKTEASVRRIVKAHEKLTAPSIGHYILTDGTTAATLDGLQASAATPIDTLERTVQNSAAALDRFRAYATKAGPLSLEALLGSLGEAYVQALGNRGISSTSRDARVKARGVADAALRARVTVELDKVDAGLQIGAPEIAFASSAGLGMTPNAANYATPVFGLAAALPIIDGKTRDAWAMPFYGLSISFAAMDRATPFHRLAANRDASPWVKRYLSQRISITVGLSITKPSVTGYSLSGLIDNKLPVFAVGYRVTQFLRLTAGGAAYRVSGSDPTKTDHLAIAPFLGLVIDADIIDVAKHGTAHI